MPPPRVAKPSTEHWTRTTTLQQSPRSIARGPGRTTYLANGGDHDKWRAYPASVPADSPSALPKWRN